MPGLRADRGEPERLGDTRPQITDSKKHRAVATDADWQATIASVIGLAAIMGFLIGLTGAVGVFVRWIGSRTDSGSKSHS